MLEDYNNTTGLIFLKFDLGVCHEQDKNAFNFAADLNPEADTQVIPGNSLGGGWCSSSVDETIQTI